MIALLGFAYWQGRVVAAAQPRRGVTRWNGDLYSAYYPVHAFAYRSAEFMPLWNPHQLAGTPFLANANGVLYPPNFLARFVPLRLALGLGCALHLALAGCAALLCARALGLSLAAAILVGLLYTLNGFVAASFIHPSHLAGYAWVPLIFLAGGRMLTAPGAGSAAALGAALALALLTGSSQTVCYSIYGLLVAGGAWVATSGGTTRSSLTRMVGAALLALVTAGLLGAAQVIPTLELASHAVRGALSVDATLAGGGRKGGGEMLRLLGAALASGGPAAALLLGAPLDARRRPLVASAAALAAFAILFGLGTPAYTQVFHYLPGVALFRIPNRMLVIGALAAAVLAGVGLDALPSSRNRSVRAGTAVVLALGGLALGLGSRFDVWTVTIAAGLAVVAWLGSSRLAPLAATGFVALVAAERFAHLPSNVMVPQHNPEAYFAPPPFADFLRERAGDGRILVVRDLNDRFPLTEKAGTLFGLDVVQDYEPLAPRAYHEFFAPLEEFNVDAPLFWGRIYPPPRDDLWRPLDLLATRYVVVEARVAWLAQPSARFAPIYDDGSVRVYENLRSLPRAYLAEQWEVIGEDGATLARLRDPELDPRKTVVLDRPAAWQSGDEAPSLSPNVRITHRSPEQVDLSVSTPRPAVLVLADLYWPGWSVSVDGTPRPLLRGNFLLRAVAIEAGEHEVRFVFRPLSVAVGATLSLLTALSLLGAGLVRRRRRPGWHQTPSRV